VNTRAYSGDYKIMQSYYRDSAAVAPDQAKEDQGVDLMETNMTSKVTVFMMTSDRTKPRWSESEAKAWYSSQPWLVGANYAPASAINQIEMWQAETFNPAEIDKELGWAEAIGMNTMRVFLHDLPYQQDPEGFLSRVDTFLTIATKHNIRTMLVLFDSVWDPDPKLGKQPAPRDGVHNSGWVQSPGRKALRDPKEYRRLEKYVKAVVGAFGNDLRVLVWDIWNEPDNLNPEKFVRREPKDKLLWVAKLLPKAFAWARSQKPAQPLTSGLWQGGDWSRKAWLPTIMRIQLEQSDVISFHNYEDSVDFRERVRSLRKYNRPLLCTEYMARGLGSTFANVLPIGAELGIGMYSWGLVQGRTQTHLPWDSWNKPYVAIQPSMWFHEVFHSDGRPYEESETELIRQLTSQAHHGVGIELVAAAAAGR
jgi:hypothetical protein